MLSPALLFKPSSWCLDIIPHPRLYTLPHLALPHPTPVSSCFTSSYSRYIKGTGSVLLVSVPCASLQDPSPKRLRSEFPRKEFVLHESTREYSEHWQQQYLDSLLHPDYCWNANTMDVTTASSSASTSACERTAAGIVENQKELTGRRDSHAEVEMDAIISPAHELPTPFLRLRYFTPTELLNLFGFPVTFKWKAVEAITINDTNADRKDIEITRKQQYELIGNSINVTVVTELLLIMFAMYKQ